MGDGRSLRVLITEDDYLVSEMIRGLLGELHHSVAGVASTGRDAVAMVRRLQPDVVLMDIRMPDMDGIEATRLIAGESNTPVVMLTAYETPDLVAQAGEAGAAAFLVKPPTARELDRAITIAVARAQDIGKLREMNAELQARNEELDAFAHTIAHDLRDLLGRIVGFAGALEETLSDLTPEELRSHLGIITQSGRKMSEIIDALLLLATVPKAEVERRPLEMGTIIAGALERLAEPIQASQATIVQPESWPSALGYAPWVEEVWLNYISNAIRYGGRPPRIELGATEEPGGEVYFWVSDNGRGIPPDALDRLFRPFTRLGHGPDQGSGLGLSIVLRIVRKLGGEVRVSSTPGQGSIFGFTLPQA